MNLKLLPIFFVLWALVSVIITYSIAVGSGHVYWCFPYISDTGAVPIESCIFAYLFNVSAVTLCVIMIFRYKILANKSVSPKLNKAALIVGLIECFGFGMVVNFSEKDHLPSHSSAALIIFMGGVFYNALQSWLSLKQPNLKTSVKAFRIGISIFTALILIFCITFSTISIQKMGVTDLEERVDRIMKWKPGEPGYKEHLLGVFSEWLLTISIFSFILSYIVEFRDWDFRGIHLLNVNSAPEGGSV